MVAIVQLAFGVHLSDVELRDRCSHRLGRYNLAKAIIRVPVIARGPNGMATTAAAMRSSG